jgi:hypothetical protein
VLLSFAFLNLNKNGQQDCNSNVGELLVRHRKDGECQNNSGKKAVARGGESRVLFVLYFWVGFSVWPNCGGNDNNNDTKKCTQIRVLKKCLTFFASGKKKFGKKQMYEEFFF